jgi:SnoaL-like polyketide cyclase
MTGTQRAEFLGVPPIDKHVKVDGMIFFRFEDSKIIERAEFSQFGKIVLLAYSAVLSAVINLLCQKDYVSVTVGICFNYSLWYSFL